MQENDSRDFSDDIVRILVYLYSVVMALALKTAVSLTIAPNDQVLHILDLSLQGIAMFGIFFITLVPFYHGAALYIVKSYKKSHIDRKKGEALLDFIALELEAIIFTAMSQSILNIKYFIPWYSCLLVLDILWVGFTYYKSTTPTHRAPTSWALLNGLMVLILIITYGFIETGEVWIYLLLLATTILRTFIDYSRNYDFYFS